MSSESAAGHNAQGQPEEDEDSDWHPPAPPGQSVAPWADPGWLDDATSWIHKQLARHGRAASGPIEEIKKWSISCVLRIPTERGDVYFKAVPPLFAQEGAITERLAALFPDDVPALLAVDLPRAWMLLDDFGKEMLKTQPLAVWVATMARFARMQVECVARAEAFLAAGVPDRRLERLSEHLGQLLEDPLVHEALKPEELARLRELSPQLRAVMERLAQAPPPPTLIHGDLHSSNVAIQDGRAIFYDWTDAAVSHPYFDLVTLLPRAERLLPDDPDAVARIREAYLGVWSEAGYAPGHEPIQAVCHDALRAGSLHHALNYRNIVAATGQENRSEWIGGLGHFLRVAISSIDESPPL